MMHWREDTFASWTEPSYGYIPRRWFKRWTGWIFTLPTICRASHRGTTAGADVGNHLSFLSFECPPGQPS